MNIEEVEAALQQINNRLITEKEFQYIYFVSWTASNTIKFLNFWTPENFAVVNRKFKQRGQTLVLCIQKMQME